MGVFWKRRWQRYVESVDWEDVVNTQCRPLNLIIILFVVVIIECVLWWNGLFESGYYLWAATACGVIALGCDFTVWRLRDRGEYRGSYVPVLIGMDGIFYGLCASLTALGVRAPFSYGVWSLYFITLAYWGFLSGVSAICASFLLAGPLACLFAISRDPIEYIIWILGLLVYFTICRNVGHKRTEEAKRQRIETAIKTTNEILNRYYHQTKVVHALMSHDLKNKFGGVLINAEFLKTMADEGKISKEAVEIVGDILDSARECKRILHDFLDSNGGANEYFSLSKIGENVFDRSRVHFRGLIPRVRVVGSLENFIFVLTNLIDNAVEAGANTVEIVVTNVDVKGKTVLVFVKDDGPGVPREVRKNLFLPVQSAKSNGTGLGLFLSRQLLRGYGGDLELVNIYHGGGAHFMITLVLDSVE